MNWIDVHAYWDPGRMSLSEMAQLVQRSGFSRAILSAPCTEGFEPDKSPFMYALQRVLLRNDLLRPLAQASSACFYDNNGRLRALWRLFTRNAQPIRKVLFPDNQQLCASIQPFRAFYTWYWINPLQMPPEKEIEESLQNPRVVGIKLHAYWHGFTPSQAEPIFCLAMQKQLPIYLIMTFKWLDAVPGFLEKFSSIPFVFGYGGFPFFDKTWRLIRPFSNAYVDLSSFHIDASGVKDAVLALGPDRCLYGSDCPYNFKGQDGTFNYSLTVDRVQRLELSSQEKEKILVQNALKILLRCKEQPAPTGLGT